VPPFATLDRLLEDSWPILLSHKFAHQMPFRKGLMLAGGWNSRKVLGIPENGGVTNKAECSPIMSLDNFACLTNDPTRNLPRP
jgi:hypothetical protein